MVCDGVLHSHRILKTVKRSVKNNKLDVLSNIFSKQNILFCFFCQNTIMLCYVVLIFYGCVGHHHMGLAISLQPKLLRLEKP